MVEKTTVRLSAAAAVYVGRNISVEAKMKAARGEARLPPAELVTLACVLAHDADGDVRKAALHTLRGVPEPFLAPLANSTDTHPRILDLLARLHHDKESVVDALAVNPGLSSGSREFLQAMGRKGKACHSEENASRDSRVEQGDTGEEQDFDQNEESEGVQEEEETEEYLSKYQLAQQMTVADKVKMAMMGDKEWRSILIKDNNKVVSMSVIKNPRITEPEILAIVKSTVQHDEIIRLICANKEWIKNYQIRKGLVLNHKTPVPFAIRCIGTLAEKDIAVLSKSKNISTVIATQARRLLLNKNKR